MTTARVFVRAIVVTDGRSPFLGEVLGAVAAQEFTPDSLHVATVGDVAVEAKAGVSAQFTAVPASASYGDAIAEVLASVPAQEGEYVWLLHDDSAPMPDVLARLAATARKRSRAAIVGAAQVRWKEPARLISLGSTVSRYGARRVDLVDDNDINQGQYDWRDDVLAVSAAGALVRRDAWDELGGFDSSYHGFGESADFSRRAWRAGYDVVVVPGALVRHAQLALSGKREATLTGRGSRASYAARRTSEWYHALVWAPLLAVPLLVVWVFLSAAARALLRVSQNEARTAWIELGVPWRVLGRLASLPRSRRRARRRATVRAGAISGLLATPGEAIHYVRTRYMRAYDKWRTAVTPTGMIRDELAASATRRRWMLAVVVIVSTGVAMAVFGGWVPALIGGQMLAGSLLGVTDIHWHTLWQRSWTGWSDAGYGAPSLDGAFSLAMVPFAALPGGMRLWLGLLLTSGVVLAAVSAWFAVGAATRAVSVRAVAALAYAVWPPFLVSISQGRVGAVLAHLALPLVALGVVRSLAWYRGEALAKGDEFTARRVASPSAAAFAALMLAFVVAVAPVVLVPAVIALVVIAACAGRRWFRVLLIAVPALVLSGPALVAAWHTRSVDEAWSILAREPGPAGVSEVADPWRTVLTLDTSPGGSEWYASPGVVAAIAISVSAAALMALLSGRATKAVSLGFAVVALGLAATFAAQRAIVVWPDGAGTATANGWSGPGLSIALLGALGGAAAASSGVWHSGGWQRVRRVGAIVLVGAAGVAVLLSATAWSWPGRPLAGDVAGADVNVLPLVAALELEPPGSERVLTLTDIDGGVAYSVLTTDGAAKLWGSAGFAPDGAPLARPHGTALAAPDDLAGAVATLVAAGVGADDDLAQWGIGVIVVTPDSSRALAGLSQVDTLELMGASGLGTAYRVTRDGHQVTRAWINEADDVDIRWDGAEGTASLAVRDAGTLVIAAPADAAWTATLAGQPLESVTDERGRQAFAVPQGGGELDVRFDDERYRTWWWAAAIACGLSLLASLPFFDRRMLGGRA